MLALLRFLVKLACLALVLAFFSSIGMAYLFAHKEITTKSIKSHFQHSNHTAK